MNFNLNGHPIRVYPGSARIFGTDPESKPKKMVLIRKKNNQHIGLNLSRLG